MAIRVLALVGPTASGKTHLSLEVARGLGAEIVSIDSAAIYRGMDVGTDKPTVPERELVRHHLIDVADPSESVSVSQFQVLARAAIEEIAARGSVPLLVGGSGLYFRAVVDPLDFPPTDPSLRSRIERELLDDGIEASYAKLRSIDPEAAAKIQPQNSRRIVRALEVVELTGAKFSSFRTRWDEFSSIYDLKVAGITHPLAELDGRIEHRIDKQIQCGLVEEVKGLIDRGLRSSLTSSKALGYAQVLRYLDGELSLEQAVDELKRRTRKFARRQLGWFRSDPRIIWFESDPSGAARYLKEV